MDVLFPTFVPDRRRQFGRRWRARFGGRPKVVMVYPGWRPGEVEDLIRKIRALPEARQHITRS